MKYLPNETKRIHLKYKAKGGDVQSYCVRCNWQSRAKKCSRAYVKEGTLFQAPETAKHWLLGAYDNHACIIVSSD